MTTHTTTKLASLPDIPETFGEDGGRFYKYYDEIADEIDDDLVKSSKLSLTAGLFAGVNSAFLALTLPQMSANPIDDTNALLLQLVTQESIQALTPADLPSASFHPVAGILSVNILLSISLTVAIFCAFLAVLAQQWLVHYRKRSGGGAEHQRWEQLRRYLGAKRWRLELILDDVLPSLLQVGLIIFCISFVIYLGTLSRTLCYVIAAPILGPMVPFQESTRTVDNLSPKEAHCILVAVKQLGRRIRLDFWSQLIANEPIDVANSAYLWFTSATHHAGEDRETLKVVALKRVLCTSEDNNAFVYAAVNVQAIRRKESLQWLLRDSEFHDRLQTLYRASFEQSLSGNCVAVEGRAFSTSFAYLMLSAGSIEDLLSGEERGLRLTQTTQRGYAYNLISRVQSDIGQLVWGTNLPVDSPCIKCPHCVSLAFCMNVIRSTILPHFHILRPEDFDQVIDLMDRRASLSLVCAVAWAITFLKRQWASTDSTARSDNLRSFLGGYRITDTARMIQIVNSAMTTLSAPWPGKPHHGIYVGLFEKTLTLKSGTQKQKLSNLASLPENLGILLQSIENRIRDPDTPVEERVLERLYRTRVISAFVEYFQSNDSFYSESQEELMIVWNKISPSI
ncbi:hypothetical protein M407DRAFT_31921 [Tulasnella calospora MUT 4182]|uniref:DUF6535 domain-containing protein n=1 Tax=Tulasnella calospora MUT 4182 TaxID=1051891 RepID=A0A0C3LAE4_9AGAM|nr:hypothetical protein M407DRAFT_31921 [Tulasnella calospora MUT 4182]